MSGDATSMPVVDVAAFSTRAASGRDQVVSEVRQACEATGFLIVTGHGLHRDALASAFASTRSFFRQPRREKDRWHPATQGLQRGYHGYETRRLARTLDQESPPDLRESFFLGPVDDHRASYAHLPEAAPVYAPNICPQSLDEVLVSLYRGFERLSGTLLRIMALALGVPETFFEDKMERHFSILACHYYPPIDRPPRPGQLRTGAHTDFGAFTILAMTQGRGGLEVRMADGRWVPVLAREGELVVNLGDMMSRWTDDRWVSTMHRVANPTEVEDRDSERQSIGYFVHPSYDAEIRSIGAVSGMSGSPRYPTITAGEHIRRKIEQSHG